MLYDGATLPGPGVLFVWRLTGMVCRLLHARYLTRSLGSSYPEHSHHAVEKTEAQKGHLPRRAEFMGTLGLYC